MFELVFQIDNIKHKFTLTVNDLNKENHVAQISFYLRLGIKNSIHRNIKTFRFGSSIFNNNKIMYCQINYLFLNT